MKVPIRVQAFCAAAFEYANELANPAPDFSYRGRLRREMLEAESKLTPQERGQLREWRC